MADLQDSHTVTSNTTASGVGDAGTDLLFQTFTTSSAYTAYAIAVKIYGPSTGSIGNITVSLRAVDGSSQPTGANLASGTIDGDNVTTSSVGEWYTAVLSSTTALSSGIEYAIVLDAPNADVGKRIIARATLSNAYTNGSGGYSNNDELTWNTYAQTDLLFKVFSAAAPTPPSTDRFTASKLVVAGSNEIWYESSAGTFSVLANSIGDIDTSDFFTMTGAFGKVFIANGTNLKIADFQNTKLVTANLGSNPPDFGTILTGGTSAAKMVVDYITSLSGACTIYGYRTTVATFASGETVTGTDDDGNAISFSLTSDEEAPPHWYNWTVFGQNSSFGVMPSKAYDVKLYRGRLCLAADSTAPNQWYMSRQRNPFNFLYGQNDAQSAVRGNDADAGETGDIVITQIPYKDDYVIHACTNTLWYISGDPAEGGSINELDLTAGILGPRTWAWDDKENLYLLSTKGLLLIPSGFGVPENLTKDTYPDFVNDIAYDPTLHRITMGYDRIRDGIIISKTTLADGTNTGWWYGLRSQGLFPESYPTQCGPFSMFWYEADDPDYRQLLIGCNDGYIRYFDDTADDDNIGDSNTAISSYVGIGPIALGDSRSEGSLNSLYVVTTGDDGSGVTADSDDVTYKLFADRTADGAIKKLIANSSPRVSGTISAPGRPRGNFKKKKVRGSFVAIRLENTTASERWGLDTVSVNGSQRGDVR